MIGSSSRTIFFTIIKLKTKHYNLSFSDMTVRSICQGVLFRAALARTLHDLSPDSPPYILPRVAFYHFVVIRS